MPNLRIVELGTRTEALEEPRRLVGGAWVVHKSPGATVFELTVEDERGRRYTIALTQEQFSGLVSWVGTGGKIRDTGLPSLPCATRSRRQRGLTRERSPGRSVRRLD